MALPLPSQLPVQLPLAAALHCPSQLAWLWAPQVASPEAESLSSHLARLPRDLEAQTAIFIQYRSLSAVGTQLSLALAGFYQGRKDVRTPMYAGIAANVLNLVLDYLLIFGWNGVNVAGHAYFGTAPLGVKGAALATTAAVCLNALLLAIPLVLSPAIRRRYRMHVPRQP